MSEAQQENTNTVHKGTVKWFRNSLGYGFLTHLDGDKKGTDVFVHHSGINPEKSQYKTLQQGEYVEFGVTPGDNGPQAVNVRGVCGGPLMCDYWHDKRESNFKGKVSKKKPVKESKKSPISQEEEQNSQEQEISQST